MIVAILAAALACQWEYRPQWGHEPYDKARYDNEFWIGMEGSVECRTPEPYATLINRMGVPCWHCRDMWTRRLERLVRANPEASRWLIRGRKNKDPEIALRCNAMLRRLNQCAKCEGAGVMTRAYQYACPDCGGYGTMWAFWFNS